MRQKISSAPLIETERLRLRPHIYGDFDVYKTMWQDANFCRFIGGKALAEEYAWTKMIRHAGHWACIGFGYWALEEKSSGQFIGEAGLADFKRDCTPSLKGLQEAGWGLTPAAHGRGYASEALYAILAWRDHHFPTLTTACMIAPENRPSIRLAEKFGFGNQEAIHYKGDQSLLLKRPPQT